MRRIRAIALLLAALGLVAMSIGCTTTHKDPSGYYHRRGTVHADSFPPNYVPGRQRGSGAYGGYGGYGRYGRW